jgi:hypothetical protein
MMMNSAIKKEIRTILTTVKHIYYGISVVGNRVILYVMYRTIKRLKKYL